MFQALPTLVMTALVSTTASDRPPDRTLIVQLIHRCRPGTNCLSRRIIALMKKETERIWSSLDVRVAWIDSLGAASAPHPAGLTVLLEDSTHSESPAAHEFVLATLTQPATTCGWGLAHVWVRHVERHAALVRRADHGFTTFPAALADTFIGRALGRSLAHEIGHYLLGTRQHTAHGLMRAQFTPQDLLDGATRPLYGLDSEERAALMSCRTSRESESSGDGR